jgi:hypothetical protein
MSGGLTKEELEKQLDELHRKELIETDLMDRMDIDPDASYEAKEYIKAFAGEGDHDAGLEEHEMSEGPIVDHSPEEIESAMASTSEKAMDVSHDDLVNVKEVKKGGKSKRKTTRKTKKSMKKRKTFRRIKKDGRRKSNRRR